MAIQRLQGYFSTQNQNEQFIGGREREVEEIVPVDACSGDLLLTEESCYEVSTSFGFNKDHCALSPCNSKHKMPLN